MATVLTGTGEEYLVDLLQAAISTPPAYIGSGIGSGTTCKGSTGLFTESCDVRSTGTFSEAAADKLRNVGTITYGATKTITNAGELLTTSTGNQCGLIVHGDFTGIVVNSADKIQFTVDLEIT